MVGLSVHESGGGGYLVLSRRVARAMTTWPMPQLEDGVRHGFKVSRFPDFWPYLGGRAYSPQGSWHVPVLLEGGGV